MVFDYFFDEQHHEGEVDAAQRRAKYMPPAQNRTRQKVAVDFDVEGPVVRLCEGVRGVVVRRVHDHLMPLADEPHCRVHHLMCYQ
jgi:pyruvate kinase